MLLFIFVSLGTYKLTETNPKIKSIVPGLGTSDRDSQTPKNTACSSRLLLNELPDTFRNALHTLGVRFTEQPSCLWIIIVASKDVIVLI